MQPVSPFGSCSRDSRFGRDLGFTGLFASILQTLDLRASERRGCRGYTSSRVAGRDHMF